MTTLLNDYAPDTTEYKEIVKLYKRSYREQWSPDAINWEQGTTLDPVKRVAGARVISQILHGEQASLLVVSQLMPMLEDMTMRYFLATQLHDEAKHADVLQRYCTLLDRIYPPNPGMTKLAESLLAFSAPAEKLVGMHILVEGLALETFHAMANHIDDPLLKEILSRTAMDESRHIAFGTVYLRKIVAGMNEAQRRKLYALQSGLGLLVAGLIVDEAEAIVQFGLDLEQLTTRILRSHYHRLQEIGLTDD
jgi:rubrerythrin